MVGRPNRFHGRGSIQRLYGFGKTVRCGSISLRYAPNEHRKTYRMAVVVSRKVSKSAVVRNRIRRRIYERVRILSSSLVMPCDLVFVIYDEKITTLPVDELTTDITKLLIKARLTSAKPVNHAIVEP